MRPTRYEPPWPFRQHPAAVRSFRNPPRAHIAAGTREVVGSRSTVYRGAVAEQILEEIALGKSL
jgi:hypothetical protein